MLVYTVIFFIVFEVLIYVFKLHLIILVALFWYSYYYKLRVPICDLLYFLLVLNT